MSPMGTGVRARSRIPPTCDVSIHSVGWTDEDARGAPPAESPILKSDAVGKGGRERPRQ